MAGVYGKTVGATNANVIIDSTGKLGTSGSGVLSAAFFASLDVGVPNVTGDGTFYNVICDLVDYDVGGDYDNTTGRFTAPIDGYYSFSAGVTVSGLTGNNGTICFMAIGQTGPNGYFMDEGSWFASSNSFSNPGAYATSGTIMIKMTAGEEANFTIAANGAAGSLSVSVVASASPGDYRTWFTGYLVATF